MKLSDELRAIAAQLIRLSAKIDIGQIDEIDDEAGKLLPLFQSETRRLEERFLEGRGGASKKTN